MAKYIKPDLRKIKEYLMQSPSDENTTIVALIDYITELEHKVKVLEKRSDDLQSRLAGKDTADEWHKRHKPYTAQASTRRINPCSNPMPHEFGSLPCCEGIIRVNPQASTGDISYPHTAEHYSDGSVFCILCEV